MTVGRSYPYPPTAPGEAATADFGGNKSGPFRPAAPKLPEPRRRLLMASATSTRTSLRIAVSIDWSNLDILMGAAYTLWTNRTSHLGALVFC